MARIVVNADELRSAMASVSQSVGNSEAMFASVKAKMQMAMRMARTDAEKARIAKELAAFQMKAKVALVQIRGNAERTNAAFSRRLSLVAGKRG